MPLNVIRHANGYTVIFDNVKSPGFQQEHKLIELSILGRFSVEQSMYIESRQTTFTM